MADEESGPLPMIDGRPVSVEANDRIRELEECIRGLMCCFEEHVARESNYQPEDEYEAMMFPHWERAGELLGKRLLKEGGEDAVNERSSEAERSQGADA